MLSLTQIAERVGIPKSTGHRLLATLESKRFVSRDHATGNYRLGFRLIELAALVFRHAELERCVQPHLHRLSAECGETVDLAILDGTHVVYLQVVESAQRVRIAAEVGHRLPVFCTATGRAFMAYLPDEQVRAILNEGLTRYTAYTRLTLPDLWAAVQDARSAGVCDVGTRVRAGHQRRGRAAPGCHSLPGCSDRRRRPFLPTLLRTHVAVGPRCPCNGRGDRPRDGPGNLINPYRPENSFRPRRTDCSKRSIDEHTTFCPSRRR